MTRLDYTPFAPRAAAFHAIVEHAGHRLKGYSVRFGERPVDWEEHREGIEMALAALPKANPDQGRPGVGFLIVHRGRAAEYVVLAWWDRQNELPVRVFVHNEGPWRPARDGESFCVWDLELFARERDAYVGTVLADGDAEAYLARRATVASGLSPEVARSRVSTRP
jgi:hypothetical protein